LSGRRLPTKSSTASHGTAQRLALYAPKKRAVPNDELFARTFAAWH
jgi:hypothetical protein